MSVFISKTRIFLIICLVVVVSAIAAAIYFNSWLVKSIAVAENDRTVVVQKGQSLYGLAYQLDQNNLISFPSLWVYYARFSRQTDIKAGEYRLNEIESPSTLLATFNKGKVVQHRVTFIEGSTAADVLSTLSKQESLDRVLPVIFDVSAPSLSELDVPHLEGWLYPDTYFYSAGETDVSLLLRAYNKMKKVLEDEWENRSPGLPLDNAYEALILASIVEKETGAPHERAEIAGVFTRRLQRGMRLQTDPTVIYGMGEQYDGNIRRADLRRPTPYNTYTISGLPPTPIALAGREALHAVLHPADGDSLYFVAKGDGTHYFSSTLEEHNAAVRRYQLSRKENYQSRFKQKK